MTAEEKQLNEKIVTVSNVLWYKTGFGKCPQCGRERDLGRTNLTCDDGQPSRCIDCHFGPPMEYWDSCENCGQLYVGDKCDNPKCGG